MSLSLFLWTVLAAACGVGLALVTWFCVIRDCLLLWRRFVVDDVPDPDAPHAPLTGCLHPRLDPGELPSLSDAADALDAVTQANDERPVFRGGDLPVPVLFRVLRSDGPPRWRVPLGVIGMGAAADVPPPPDFDDLDAALTYLREYARARGPSA